MLLVTSIRILAARHKEIHGLRLAFSLHVISAQEIFCSRRMFWVFW